MASSHFLHSLIAPSTHFLLFPFAFLTFWFTFAVLLVPVMPVKRESGVNPEQTRCCKSSKASMASTPLCLRAWEGCLFADKPEDLPTSIS